MPRWNVNFDTRVNVRDQKILYLVARIHALASVVRNIPIPPGTQASIDALNILRAVRGTTGIEGADLSEEEVRLIMDAPSEEPVLPKNRSREEQEARNAEQVMYFVAEVLSSSPTASVTEDLICTIHEITTENIPYPNNAPGKYRNHPVTAGSYSPPESGEDVRRLMREFIQWFNEGASASWDPVVKAVVAHFYVVSIHPFGDGNGRTARGVESFLLYQAGINARGFYSLANFYYRRRNDYIRLLDRVRFETGGDLTPFVIFALNGLMEELEAVQDEILLQVKVIAFRDFARETLLSHGKLGSKAAERLFHFLLELADRPASLKALRNGEDELSYLYRNVTARTLSRDIAFLKQHELAVQEGDMLLANLEIMTRFTIPIGKRKPWPAR